MGIKITFTEIMASEFTNAGLEKFRAFCKSNKREYKIKMQEMNLSETARDFHAHEGVVISVSIGLWDDNIQNDE